MQNEANMSFSHRPESLLPISEEKQKSASVELPPEVDPKRINPSNGKLLREKAISIAKTLPLGHYHRKKEVTELEEDKETKQKRYKTVLLDGPDRVDCRYSISSVTDLKGEKVPYAVYRKKNEPVILGSGASGVVKLAQNLLTGEWDVTKIFKPKTLEEAKRFEEEARAELEIYKALGFARSELIVRKSRKTGLPKYQFYMKRAKGKDLFEVLSKGNLPKDPVKLLVMARNIAHFLKHILRNARLVHRDLKIENVMIDILSGEAAIIDYNLAGKMNQEGIVNDGRTCGSIDTASPEILYSAKKLPNGKVECTFKDYSEATDIYGLGIVLKALLFGEVVRPRKGQPHEVIYLPKDFSMNPQYSHTQVISLFPEGEGPFDANVELKGKVRALVDKMCSGDPAKRPSIEEVCAELRVLFQEALNPSPPLVSPPSSDPEQKSSEQSSVSHDSFPLDGQAPVSGIVPEVASPELGIRRMESPVRLDEVKEVLLQSRTQELQSPGVPLSPPPVDLQSPCQSPDAVPVVKKGSEWLSDFFNNEIGKKSAVRSDSSEQRSPVILHAMEIMVPQPQKKEAPAIVQSVAKPSKRGFFGRKWRVKKENQQQVFVTSPSKSCCVVS